MLRLGMLLVLLAVPSVVRADILMWRDADGVKHYTNSKALVPAEASASVLLEEPQPPVGLPAAAAPAPEAPPAPHEAQVVYDQDALAAAFAEGLQRGLDTARQMQPAVPVNVQVNGPLVAAVGGNGDGGCCGPSWIDYNYPPLVTTSFDNGRSRHLTLRMLMQDQFAIDREGPYFVVDRFPPLGPDLVTVLPRGLPFFTRPGSRFVNRVITH